MKTYTNFEAERRTLVPISHNFIDLAFREKNYPFRRIRSTSLRSGRSTIAGSHYSVPKSTGRSCSHRLRLGALLHARPVVRRRPVPARPFSRRRGGTMTIDVRLIHVKGHSVDGGNDRADELARWVKEGLPFC